MKRWIAVGAALLALCALPPDAFAQAPPKINAEQMALAHLAGRYRMPLTCVRADGSRVALGPTDRTEMAAGDVFVALRGPRFNGAEFVAAAATAGAVAAVVDASTVAAAASAGLPLIVVADVLAALQRAALAHRERFAGTVIARRPVASAAGNSCNRASCNRTSSHHSSGSPLYDSLTRCRRSLTPRAAPRAS